MRTISGERMTIDAARMRTRLRSWNTSTSPSRQRTRRSSSTSGRSPPSWCRCRRSSRCMSSRCSSCTSPLRRRKGICQIQAMARAGGGYRTHLAHPRHTPSQRLAPACGPAVLSPRRRRELSLPAQVLNQSSESAALWQHGRASRCRREEQQHGGLNAPARHPYRESRARAPDPRALGPPAAPALR